MIIVPSVSQPDVFAINVFRARPDNQQLLIDCIRDVGGPADIPGLLSMHLLCSTDGTQVTNFMRWASGEALQAAAARTR